MIDPDDTIADLHRIVFIEGKVQSPNRLNLLAEYCIQELELRGLTPVEAERAIPGVGREKKWDVAWEYDGKMRLGISLKSILRNLPGTAPNRIDDLMGEVANVQLNSPEVVVGYVIIVNRSNDPDGRWALWLRERLDALSGRNAPSWSPGTIEAYVLLEAGFDPEPRLMSGASDFPAFFDTLAERVRHRNPGYGDDA